MLETIGLWVFGIGLAFDLFGCIGLVRLPDVYNRAQAATKCVTLGTCMILLGTAFIGAGHGNWAMFVKALMCAGFILLTSPVGAHAVCRAAYIFPYPVGEGTERSVDSQTLDCPKQDPPAFVEVPGQVDT